MYAGFNQLVHLSSGVIRVFLETASLMFEETKKDDPENKIAQECIPYQIQNDVIRKYSENELFLRFDGHQYKQPNDLLQTFAKKKAEKIHFLPIF